MRRIDEDEDIFVDDDSDYMPTKSNNSKVVTALVVIIAGFTLLAFNFGLIPHFLRRVIISWPMILCVVGVITLMVSPDRKSGLIILAVGAFFLIPRIFYFDFNFTRKLWPLLIIIGGAALLLKNRQGNGANFFNVNKNSRLDLGIINESNIFAGSERTIDPTVFKGGKIDNIFGGTKIDLRRTTLAEGNNILEVNCIFGGVELIVPSSWKIKIEVTPILGGFNDQRYSPINNGYEEGKLLIIKGAVIFGGGELKN